MGEMNTKTARMKKIAFAAALLIVAAVQTPLLADSLGDMADDAMISARYARNLARGHGLRYNLAPKDAQPVEGYSNFLWVMALWAGFETGVSPRTSTAWLGGLFSLGAVIALGMWVFQKTRSWLMGAASALILAVNPAWLWWSVQGLETPMFAFFCLAALALAGERRSMAPAYLLALAACLTRPDGLLVPAAVFVADLATRERPLKASVMSAMWFAVPFVLYTAWRVWHFGALLPNVYHAKTGLGAAGVKVGVLYLYEFAARQWPYAVFVLGGVAAAFSRNRSAALAPVLFIVLYLGFILWVGGDFMPDHRFVMQVLPLMCGIAFVAWGGEGARTRFPPRPRNAVIFLLCVIAGASVVQSRLVFPLRKDISISRAWHMNQADWYGPVSSWLRRNTEREDVIACGDIGYIGYVTDVDRILDTNGLVDPYLAQRPGAAAISSDPGYVLDSEPDFLVVMVHEFEGGQVVGHTAFDRSVLALERLHRHYTLRAELPGWTSVERSLDDGVVRKSEVRFRVYEGNQKEGPE